jgi:hypothetical protein
MPTEKDKYDLCASASDLVDEMRSKGLDTAIWTKMLETAFLNDDVDALNKVIVRLRAKLTAHDIRQLEAC